MQIIQKKLADIVPYANNTKKHDETQIKNVAESKSLREMEEEMQNGELSE